MKRKASNRQNPSFCTYQSSLNHVPLQASHLPRDPLVEWDLLVHRIPQPWPVTSLEPRLRCWMFVLPIGSFVRVLSKTCRSSVFLLLFFFSLSFCLLFWPPNACAYLASCVESLTASEAQPTSRENLPAELSWIWRLLVEQRAKESHSSRPIN